MSVIRTAVIGAGGWGTNIIRALGRVPGAELSLICDSNPKKIEALAKQYPHIRFTADVLEVERASDIDAVIIATPSPTHAGLAEKFLKSKRAVFVEKPMVLSLSDAAKLVELTEQGLGPLMVGHLLIYHPAMEMVRRLVIEKSIGELFYLYTKRLNLGIVRKDENSLWSLAPHDISIILYLMGERPEAVCAFGSPYLTKNVEDVTFLTLFFKNKRIAQVHVSWLDPYKERKLVVVGSKKMVVFDDMEPNEKVKIYDKGAEVKGSADYVESISIRHGDILIPLVPNREPLVEEMKAFIESVKNNKPPLADARQGYEVVEVLSRGEESLRSGGAMIKLS